MAHNIILLLEVATHLNARYCFLMSQQKLIMASNNSPPRRLFFGGKNLKIISHVEIKNIYVMTRRNHCTDFYSFWAVHFRESARIFDTADRNVKLWDLLVVGQQ